MEVSVRPERVRVSAARPKQRENILAGTIDFVSYLGSHVTYIIRIEGTTAILRADERLISGNATFSEGQSVYASWDSASAVCLRC